MIKIYSPKNSSIMSVADVDLKDPPLVPPASGGEIIAGMFAISATIILPEMWRKLWKFSPPLAGGS